MKFLPTTTAIAIALLLASINAQTAWAGKKMKQSEQTTSCPVMTREAQAMMKSGMSRQMLDHRMRPGGPKMGQRDCCWIESKVDRADLRGYGYWAACKS